MHLIIQCQTWSQQGSALKRETALRPHSVRELGRISDRGEKLRANVRHLQQFKPKHTQKSGPLMHSSFTSYSYLICCYFLNWRKLVLLHITACMVAAQPILLLISRVGQELSQSCWIAYCRAVLPQRRSWEDGTCLCFLLILTLLYLEFCIRSAEFWVTSESIFCGLSGD